MMAVRWRERLYACPDRRVVHEISAPFDRVWQRPAAGRRRKSENDEGNANDDSQHDTQQEAQWSGVLEGERFLSQGMAHSL